MAGHRYEAHQVWLNGKSSGFRWNRHCGVKPISSWNSPRLLMAYAAFFFDVVGCLRRSLLISSLQLCGRDGNDRSRAPVHLSNERDRRGGVRHARVRQPWKAGPQPRGLRLVRHEVRSTAAVPMHRLQGHAEYEHGDRVQRASLHPTGVRPRSQLTRRRREHFCDGPGHGPFPQHRRALARAGLDGACAGRC